MRVEDGVLFVDEEISDDRIEEFLAVISQEDLKKVEVSTVDISASIVQLLLIKKQKLEIILEDEVLKKIFENVVYKTL